MNPFDLILEDHRTVDALFEEYETIPKESPVERRELVDSILHLLSLHTEMEETIAYPMFRDALTDGSQEDEERDLVDAAYEEHEEAKELMAELQDLSPEEPGFDDRVAALRAAVMTHVEEEETELLPEAQQTLSEEAQHELAERLRSFKDAHLA